MAIIDALELVVDEKAHNYAKIYSSLLNDEFQRKRAYASIFALYALINELEKTDNDIQKSMTLFRNPVLNEQYEISDVYVNNWHIDVRVIVDGDAFLVPKTHFENNIQPDFYAVVKVDKMLTKAELLGFSNTKTLTKKKFDNNYYSVSLDTLISLDEFLQNVAENKVVNFSDEEHEFFRNTYLNLLDEELDASTKNRLLKHIFDCPKCKTEFCCFTGFEMVSCNMGKYPNLLQDQTLDIIGAQIVENSEYVGKEETIYFDDREENDLDSDSDETSQNNQSDEETSEEILEDTEEELEIIDDELEIIEDSEVEEIKEETEKVEDAEEVKEYEKYEETEKTEETVSDILDELFNIDEDFMQADSIPEKEVNTDLEIIEDSDDMQIIEENYDAETNDEIEIIEKEEIVVDEISDNLEIIEDEHTYNEYSSKDEEFVVLEQEGIEPIEDDLVVTEEEATVAADLIDMPQDEVQKVVVDYDEYGEPIYSYITNVAQQEELDENTQIEPLDDDDILNMAFEPYPQQQDDITQSLTQVNGGTARTVEYITNDGTENLEEILDENQDEILPEKEEYLEDELEASSEYQEDEQIVNYDDAQEEEKFEIELEQDEIDETDETSETETENNVEELQYVDELEESLTDSVETEAEVGDEEYPVEEYPQDEEYSENEEYEEYEDDEEYFEEEDNANSSTKRNLMIVSTLVILALVACGAGIFFFMKKQTPEVVVAPKTENTVEIPEVNDMFGPVDNNDVGIEIPVAKENTKVPEVKTVEPGIELPPPPPTTPTIETPVQTKPVEKTEPQKANDYVPAPKKSNPAEISKSIANAFSPTGNVVSLRAVNWLCAPQLFADGSFKAYLQNLDNILKLNLRKNILDITEAPQSNEITLKMAVDNSGNLLKVVVAESTGSENIDNIVLRSINETFESEKGEILSAGPQKADKYYLKVVIKL